MKEYIERDEVRKIASMFFTMSMCASEDECRAMNRAIRIVEKRIDSIPAADVVPVVRCGECKYWTESSAIPLIGCCAFTPMRHTAEFFCANGARMDGDANG